MKGIGTPRKAVLVLCVVVLTAPAACPGATPIENDPDYFLIGTLRENFTALSGSTSGVTVDMGSGPVSTGDIDLQLDPMGDSYIEYNFDVTAAHVHLDLLATFPLQEQIGAPPVPLSIEEDAPIIQARKVAFVPGDVAWYAHWDGFLTPPGGTPLATSGALDATSSQPTADPWATFFIESHGYAHGTVETGPFAGISFEYDPNNWKQQNTNIGQINVTPEPCTALLLGASGAGLIGLMRRRRQTAS